MTGLLRPATIALSLTMSVVAVAPTHAISGTPSGRPAPDFSGTWQPTEQPNADVFFAAGISPIPRDGRLIIVQDASEIKLTWRVPPKEGRPPHPAERSDSYRIAPEAAPGAASWKGTSLLIQHPDSESPNVINVTSVLTLVDGDLQIDNTWQRRQNVGRPNAMTFKYQRTPTGGS